MRHDMRRSDPVSAHLDDCDPWRLGSVHPSQHGLHSIEPDGRSHERCRIEPTGLDEIEQLTEARRIEAPHAQDRELTRIDEVEKRKRHNCVSTNWHPDLHVSAQGSKRAQRIVEGGLHTEAVDRNVCSSPTDVVDCSGDIVDTRRIDHLVHPCIDGELQGARVDVDRNRSCTERTSEQQRCVTDTAGPVHHQPFAGLQSAAISDGPPRRGDPASDSCGGNESESVGQSHKIELCPRDGHELGEASPRRETDHMLVSTDRGRTRSAIGAGPTAENERRRHAISDRERSTGSAHRNHLARKFVAHHVWQHDIGIDAFPRMVIGTAHTTRPHRYHHPVCRAGRIGNVDHRDWAVEHLEHARSHRQLPTGKYCTDNRPALAIGADSTGRNVDANAVAFLVLRLYVATHGCFENKPMASAAP